VFELNDADGVLGGMSDVSLTRSYAYNAYLDAPLLMIDEDGSSAGGGPVGFKFYYLQDRRFSVVGMVNTSGTVLERYRYQAFGRWTVHRASGGWLSPTNNVSLF